ncbi:MAG: hypothetical protein SGJ09_12550 [Phycisphaerae bacterium]|nr:hypothetical protein [Phycisphaerae bacterium]
MSRRTAIGEDDCAAIDIELLEEEGHCCSRKTVLVGPCAARIKKAEKEQQSSRGRPKPPLYLFFCCLLFVATALD